MSKKPKERMAAIIIQDKKILLVTGFGLGVYWLPGGKPHDGESHLETIKREVFEELGINVEFGDNLEYGSAEDKKEAGGFNRMQNYYSLVSGYDGEIAPMAEITDAHWFSKEDFFSNKFRATSGTREFLIPKLIEDGLL